MLQENALITIVFFFSIEKIQSDSLADHITSFILNSDIDYKKNRKSRILVGLYIYIYSSRVCWLFAKILFLLGKFLNRVQEKGSKIVRERGVILDC